VLMSRTKESSSWVGTVLAATLFVWAALFAVFFAGPGALQAAEGETAACALVQEQVCGEAGERSEACVGFGIVAPSLSTTVCKAILADFTPMMARIAQQRSHCDQLVSKLCTDIGEKSETCAMVKERVAEFPAEQCKMMLGEYAQVLGELRQVEQQNQPLSAALQARQVAGELSAYGPKDAKVTLVEYSDFECPYCSKAADAVTVIKARYGKVVRVVFRQFPLSFHPDAMPAAQASLAARAQGRFWDYHDLLFANNEKLDRASLEGYAKTLGLDMKAFRADLDKGSYAAAVEADLALGGESGVQGTPSMFVNGKRVPNPTDVSVVAELINAELSAAGVAIPPLP
jgi:protein-disulfide isomerase